MTQKYRQRVLRSTQYASILTSIALCFFAIGPQAEAAVTNLSAEHRSGQTFVTWTEDGSSDYTIYRHTSAINAGNLAQATSLGSVDDDSSFYASEASRSGSEGLSDYYVIEDLGTPLTANDGLYVYTPEANGTYYYAVKSFDASLAATGGISETDDRPQSVLVWRSASKRGRIYTQFQHQDDWNSTVANSIALNYFIGVPPGYNYSNPTKLPFTLQLGGANSRYTSSDGTPSDWNTIYIRGDEPFITHYLEQAWYFGSSMSHNYEGSWPSSGPIGNSVENYLVRAIEDTIQSSDYNVDETKIYGYGHSMGGSGILTLGVRYPELFDAIYASKGATNHKTMYDLAKIATSYNFGPEVDNFPIDFVGNTKDYDIASFDGTGAWDWQNTNGFLTDNPDRDIPIIAAVHSTEDTSIYASTQGYPFYKTMDNAKQSFMGIINSAGHSWQNFVAASHPNFTFTDFDFPGDEMHPAFSDVSGNKNVNDTSGTGNYNQDVEWSASNNDFNGESAETQTTLSFSVRSRSGSTQTADITPRNLQTLYVGNSNFEYEWTNTEIGGSEVQSGTVTGNSDNVITLPNVQISATGNTIEIDADPSNPSIPDDDDDSNNGDNGDSDDSSQSYTETLLATSPGPGGGPHVRVFDTEGNWNGTQFFAYDEAFRGGVRLASGDVDGDGTKEIITGPGRGGGPHVRVFEQDGTPKPIQFFAFHPDFHGGIDVAAGDVDGDGTDEIAVCQYSDGQAWVKVYTYETERSVIGTWNAFGSPEVGCTITMGDIDVDGEDEVIVGAGNGGGPHIRVFEANGQATALQFFAFHPNSRSGIDVAAADTDGDTLAEIAATQLLGEQAWTKLYATTPDKPVWAEFNAFGDPEVGANVELSNIYGSSALEILTGANVGGGPQVRTFERDGDVLNNASFFAYDEGFRGGVSVVGLE